MALLHLWFIYFWDQWKPWGTGKGSGDRWKVSGNFWPSMQNMQSIFVYRPGSRTLTSEWYPTVVHVPGGGGENAPEWRLLQHLSAPELCGLPFVSGGRRPSGGISQRSWHTLCTVYCKCEVLLLMLLIAFIKHCSPLSSRLTALTCDSAWVNSFFGLIFEYPPQWCTHMKLLTSRHVLYTPYNHAPCHFMQSYICRVHAYLTVSLAVTFLASFALALPLLIEKPRLGIFSCKNETM